MISSEIKLEGGWTAKNDRTSFFLPIGRNKWRVMTRRIWIYEEANLDTCLTPVPQQSWDSEWLQQGVPTATCACYHSRRIWFVLARREVCGKSSPNWVVCEVMGVPLVIIHWNRLFPSSRNHPAISSWGYSRFPTGNHEASETECSVTDYNKDGEPSGFSTQCVKEGTACPCGKNTISCPDPNDVTWHCRMSPDPNDVAVWSSTVISGRPCYGMPWTIMIYHELIPMIYH